MNTMLSQGGGGSFSLMEYPGKIGWCIQREQQVLNVMQCSWKRVLRCLAATDQTSSLTLGRWLVSLGPRRHEIEQVREKKIGIKVKIRRSWMQPRRCLDHCCLLVYNLPSISAGAVLIRIVCKVCSFSMASQCFFRCPNFAILIAMKMRPRWRFP